MKSSGSRNGEAKGMQVQVMFQVGEFVIHPTQGPCRIQAIEERPTRGGTETCYVFFLGSPKDRITMTVPIEKAEAAGLRRPITKQQAGEVLDVLRAPAGRVSQHPNNQIEWLWACLNRGALLEIAAAARDLAATGVQAHGELAERGFVSYRYRGKALLGQALEQLTEELALVQGIPKQHVKRRIEKDLRKWNR